MQLDVYDFPTMINRSRTVGPIGQVVSCLVRILLIKYTQGALEGVSIVMYIRMNMILGRYE